MVDEAAEKKVTEMKKEQEMQDKLDKAETIIAADEAKKEKAEKAKAVEEQATTSLRPAQINDPDGYTNVRKSANSSAAVVGVIYFGDVFYVRSTANSNWVEVYLSKDAPRMGYMHRSRVKIL
ncbi:MAG: SH3 domain-containing protein [Prevotella sp.]|nr:SH3 domain-containing protein [Prevotella sp.]